MAYTQINEIKRFYNREGVLGLFIPQSFFSQQRITDSKEKDVSVRNMMVSGNHVETHGSASLRNIIRKGKQHRSEKIIK
jgi:hypothetical protein